MMASTKNTPSPTTYKALLTALILYALLAGCYAATRPTGGGFRLPFSLHPTLMTLGYVGLMGAGHLTKKLGGYANTKCHGCLATSGLVTSFGGLYAIWKNKENMGREHLTSYHSWGGLISLCGSVLPALAGLVFLHPDFGVDKANVMYRKVHKWIGRVFTLGGWVSCVVGVAKMTSSTAEVVLFAVPLIVLVPFVLV